MDLKKAKKIVKSVAVTLKTKNIVPIEKLTDPDKILNDKVAIITGGSGGIGQEIAKKFLLSGAKVIIAGTNREKLEKQTEKLKDFGLIKYVEIDFRTIENFEDVIERAAGFWGRIDILINSAGVHSTKSLTSFFNTTINDYEKIMDINLKGTYFISQAVAKYMINNGIKGHILNISSSTAAEPAWSPYRLSKQGVVNLTKGLAQSLTSYGIIVNGIAPGSTATSLLGFEDGDSISTLDNEVGRYVLPSEIAEYAKILASDLGNMVVGDTLFISGGRGTYDIR